MLPLLARFENPTLVEFSMDWVSRASSFRKLADVETPASQITDMPSWYS